MCWIWKMGWNLFSSLDIRDNSKVAFSEKKSNNPNVCLVISSGFLELSILWNCTTVLELRSVGLPLSKFGTDQLCWAEICNLKSLLQTALAPWASLSVELIFFSPLLLLSKTVSSRKLCWAHLWYLLPDIKVDRKWSNSLLRTFFSQKCHFQIISHGQWWTKKFHPFLDSTYQEWMIFARIGDGPCNYY